MGGNWLRFFAQSFGPAEAQDQPAASAAE
jgi:hypothetical protein